MCKKVKTTSSRWFGTTPSGLNLLSGAIQAAYCVLRTVPTVWIRSLLMKVKELARQGLLCLVDVANNVPSTHYVI